MSTLPNEIHFHILSFLSPRAVALPSALVCRAWLPHCREITFSRRIAIIDERDTSAEEFLDLFRNPHSTLPLFLTRLAIFMSGGASMDYDSVVSVLMQSTGNTPRTRELAFHAMGHRYAITSDKFEQLLKLTSSLLPSLLKLEVVNVHPVHVVSLLAAISEAPQLTHLVVHPYRMWCSTYPPVHIPCSPPPLLTTFETSDFDWSCLHDWLSQVAHVSTFVIRSDPSPVISQPEDVQIYRSRVRETNNGRLGIMMVGTGIRYSNLLQLLSTPQAYLLTHLDFSVDYHQGFQAHLQNATNLGIFTLRLHIDPTEPWNTTLRHLPLSLSTAPSNLVVHLHFYVVIPENQPSGRFPVSTKLKRSRVPAADQPQENDGSGLAQLDKSIDSLIAGAMSVKPTSATIRLHESAGNLRVDDFPLCSARREKGESIVFEEGMLVGVGKGLARVYVSHRLDE